MRRCTCEMDWFQARKFQSLSLTHMWPVLLSCLNSAEL